MFSDKSQLYLFLTSTIIIFLFIFFFSFVSFIYRQLLKLLFNFSITRSFFKDLLYGILITVYLYALCNSRFSLNSVTITIAPILIYLFERYNFLNSKHTLRYSKNNISIHALKAASFFKKFHKEKFISYLISFLFILLFLYCNFSFHFNGTSVNTGYLDHGWYHDVAGSLQVSGVETINIHINAENLRPGFIYHYWDLWMQAFFYHSLSIFNFFGFFSDINQFEIAVLVFQPLLVIIIFFAFKELVSKILSCYFIQFKPHFSFFQILFVATIAAIAVSHTVIEFGIIHHPKQFIIAALFILICISIIEGNKKSLSYLFFAPFFLFYYPLPGTVIILTLLIYNLVENDFKKLLRHSSFWLIIFGLVIVYGSFYYLYFIHGTTCYNNLNKTYKSESWRLVKVFTRLFIYHGYHILKSFVGIVLVLNICLICFSRYMKSIKLGRLKLVLIFVLINYCLGHFVSSILYTAPEEFQFYNNDFFVFSIMVISDLIILYFLICQPSYKLIIILSYNFILLLISYLLIFNSYFTRPIYYNAISLRFDTYKEIKKIKNLFCLNTYSSLNIPYATIDIVFSFFNNRIYYNYNKCSENELRNDKFLDTNNCNRVEIIHGKIIPNSDQDKNIYYYFNDRGVANTLTLSKK